SVVATGMDGASIAAIEPKIERRAMTAPPLRVPDATPVAAAPEPIAEPVAASIAAEEEQQDLYAAPVAAVVTPAAAPEPVVVQPVARIVDPAVSEPEDEPLFAEPAFEERRPRGGFLSIFGGRPRYDTGAPAPQPAPMQTRPAPVRGGAQPVEAVQPEEQAHQGEDLEIPSFLRRLAN
ncbi:MAG: cell division protein FtsZ, partial [Proteobacteria bacterium]|nr:cell division protein FtsZ [Pseudomonadota bacterium]